MKRAPEAGQRVADPGDLDDVDAELGGARAAAPRPAIEGRLAAIRAGHRGTPYSTVTDFARLRGWSTSVPRAIATW